MLIGYARTSTRDQTYSLEDQLEKLEKEGCSKIYQEHVSSIDSKREKLEAVLDFIRQDDTLIVTKLDRLARSVEHTIQIQKQLEAKGASLKILELNLDTSTPSGKLQFNLLAAIAEFERDIMLERQRVGIERAKAEGKYKGRKPISDKIKKRVKDLFNEKGYSKQKIADEVGVGVATVYRILKQ